MNYLIPLFFQLLGFAVLMLEVVIPSFGLLTLVSVGLLGYSWFYIVEHLPREMLMVFGLADLIMTPLCIVIGFKLLKASPMTLKRSLKKGSGLEEEVHHYSELIGQTGVVETQLKPLGKALFNNQLIEVTSDGDIIDKNQQITVIRTSGMQVIVQAVEKKDLKT